MKNDSTPLKSDVSVQTAQIVAEKPAPRKSTIALLRQFARAYSVAAPLPLALSGFVAN